jgi:hypothetical protein
LQQLSPFDFSEKLNCEKKIDENFAYCHSTLEDNAWSGQKSDMPAILKDVRQKLYKSSAVGKKIKALRANK